MTDRIARVIRAITPFLLLAPSVALAAPITLADAVKEGLAHGPAAAVVAGEARRDRAEATASGAWSGNPEVEAESAVDETTIRVNVPLDPAAPARVAAAARARDAVAVRLDAGRAAVGVAVAGAYLDAARADERARVFGDARALAERQGEAARRRLAAGEVSAADAAVLQAAAVAALSRALDAEREATLARMRLEALLGRAPTGDVEPAGWPDIPAPPAPDPARVPAVVAADLDARASLARVTAARLDLIPDLSVSAGVREAGTGAGPFWAATLEVPLFAPRAAPLAAAAGVRDVALAEADRARLDAAVAATTATRTLADARAVAAAYEGVDLAGALKTAASAWEAGELSLPDWTVRRDVILDALDASIEARWALGRASLAAWELAGTLPPELTP